MDCKQLWCGTRAAGGTHPSTVTIPPRGFNAAAAAALELGRAQRRSRAGATSPRYSHRSSQTRSQWGEAEKLPLLAGRQPRLSPAGTRRSAPPVTCWPNRLAGSELLRISPQASLRSLRLENWAPRGLAKPSSFPSDWHGRALPALTIQPCSPRWGPPLRTGLPAVSLAPGR